MFKGLSASIVALLAGVGLAWADPVPKTLPAIEEQPQGVRPAEPPPAPVPSPPAKAAAEPRAVPRVVVPPTPAAHRPIPGVVGEPIVPVADSFAPVCELPPAHDGGRFWVGAEY